MFWMSEVELLSTVLKRDAIDLKNKTKVMKAINFPP